MIKQVSDFKTQASFIQIMTLRAQF